MLTRAIRIQLVLFIVLTLAALITLGVYYMDLPAYFGGKVAKTFNVEVNQYTLYADLPASGGLYKTANVTYQGQTIGRVIDVQPTGPGSRCGDETVHRGGACATMSISRDFKIPVDATANVHSVSAVGEQYLDLVSPAGPKQNFSQGQTIPMEYPCPNTGPCPPPDQRLRNTVPREVGPALDAANAGLSRLPKEQIGTLLDETSQAVGGLGPSLQRLVDSTQAIAHDFNDNLNPINDIIANSAPILDSQVNSGDAIARWAANLNILAREAAQQDRTLRHGLQQAAPTLDQVNQVFSDVRDSLPQTLANLEIVLDMLKRYHKGVEQALVVLPQGASIAEMSTAIYPGEGLLHFGLSINQPPPCLTGFLPASEWRSPADTSMAPLPSGTYCKIPQDFQGNVVRGARNYPCADVPGKRAATPRECRSNQPYVPLGTNPWYGDPNQIRECPAPAARCDEPVDPGKVIPAPSVNNGMNPLPANMLPQPPLPTSDALSPPGQGTVQCSGQQPNPCVYTPAAGPMAIYSPQSGDVVGPDGTKFTVSSTTNTGDDGWKEMLARGAS